MPQKRCTGFCNRFEGCGVGRKGALDDSDVDVRLEKNSDDSDDSDD